MLVQKRSIVMSSDTRHFVEALVTEKETEVRAFLQRRLPSTTDAEDAFQEVFLRMCGIENPSRIENSSAFLFRTATNIVHDFYRRRMRVDVSQLQDEDQLVSDDPSPAQTLFAKQWWEDYCVAINELSPKCRRVFVMCRMQNCSHAEIAKEIRISNKMVEKYMTKALLHLRHRLGDYLSGFATSGPQR